MELLGPIIGAVALIIGAFITARGIGRRQDVELAVRETEFLKALAPGSEEEVALRNIIRTRIQRWDSARERNLKAVIMAGWLVILMFYVVGFGYASGALAGLPRFWVDVVLLGSSGTILAVGVVMLVAYLKLVRSRAVARETPTTPST